MTSRPSHGRRRRSLLTTTASLVLLLGLPAGTSLAAEGGQGSGSDVTPPCANGPVEGVAPESPAACAASPGPSASGRNAATEEGGTDQNEAANDAPEQTGDVDGAGSAAGDPTPSEATAGDTSDETAGPTPSGTTGDPSGQPDATDPDDHSADADEDAPQAALIDPTLEDPDVLGVQQSRTLGSAHTTDAATASAVSTAGGALPAAGMGALATLTAALTSFALGGTLLRRTSRRRT